MKTKSLYISTLEKGSGSLVVSIGLMQLLKSKYNRVAFFRPIIKNCNKKDSDIDTIKKYFNLRLSYEDSYGFCIDEVDDMISNDKINNFYEIILEKVKKLEQNYDFILIEGIEKDLISIGLDFDINLGLAKHISAPYISVLNMKNKEYKHIIEDIKIEEKSIKKSGCIHFGTFVNRIDDKLISRCKDYFKNSDLDYELNFLPQKDELEYLTIEQIKDNINCKYIFGKKEYLQKHIKSTKIACMSVENFIKHIQGDDLIITSGDRVDIIMAILTLYHTTNYPNISAIILTGGLKLDKTIKSLLESFNHLAIPILSTNEDTYTTTKKIDSIKSIITYKNKTKIATILGLFNTNIDIKRVEKKLQENNTNIVSPLMFQYNIFKKARENKKTIVLPESFDSRILKATQISIVSQIANI
ncbi:MAG: phosphate acyltransferase, partial [Campylobacterota bacterium]|nr:phosphate acyltransferase [Campylobacterota bacterium]